MSAETSAENHARAFQWFQGDPEFSVEEGRLHDFIALRNSTTELIRQQRDLLAHYDSDEELFGNDGRETTVDEIIDIVVGAGLHDDRDEVRERLLRFFGTEIRPADG